MAHEITKTDHVVLHKQAAWHKLGTVVQDAPTPQEALRLARLDWSVSQEPVYIVRDGERIAVPDTFANVRQDTGDIFGIVSDQYEPLQNADLAEFVGALNEAGGNEVLVESAGSFAGGRRVFFLAKGETFDVGQNDLTVPYVLLSNGHDGNHGFHCRPTSVRVVCANTQRMAMARGEHLPHFTAQHRGDMDRHLESARAIISMFRRSMDASREVYRNLASQGVDRDTLTDFAVACYRRDFPLAKGADQAAALRYKAREEKALAGIETVFDRESDQFGANRWVMLNAYTGWLQKRKPRSGQDIMYSNWLGVNATRSETSLQLAQSISA